MLIGLLLAAGSVVAVLVLQLSYGDGSNLAVARWAPQPVSALPTENLPSPAWSALPTVQVAAAETTPPQTTQLAQAASQDVTSAAPTAPDHTQLLQTMASDLAKMERDIEQLKASQQQIANDSSKAVEELKASQEEIKRALARVSEQKPPKPAQQSTAALRKPERTLQPQARTRPRIPREWLYDDEW
jgi:TolA-binding protein